MGVVVYRTNDALNINPPSGDQHLGVHGSNWLWAVTAVYALSFVVVLCWTQFARAGERIFHYIYTVALLTGLVAYFTMASDLGFVTINTQLNKDDAASRQIFYAKFINWVVAWPSILLTLGLLNGSSWATIIYHVFLSWAWTITYLAASVASSSYKWGYYALGTVVFIILAFYTLVEGHRSANRVGVARDHLLLAGWANFLWLLYPIAFGLSDGGNKIGVTSSFIFFGILDVLQIPVLACAFLFLSSNWDYNKLNLVFTQYGRVPVANGNFPEKESAPAAAPAGGVTA